MNDDWIKSPAARRIIIHWADPRPAWLWSEDGSTLIWRNRAARFFGARIKRNGLRLAAEPAPIRGQIARLIRLGSIGRSSLARLQFLAGGRPASTTATVTPLDDANAKPIVLAVGVDAIDPEILAESLPDTPVESALVPEGATYILFNPQGVPLSGSPGAVERFGALAEALDRVVLDGNEIPVTRYKASPQGHQLLVLSGSTNDAAEIADVRAEEGFEGPGDSDLARQDEPLLPLDMAVTIVPPPTHSEDRVEVATGAERPLSTLFDRLADSEVLYAGLPDAQPPDRTRPTTEAKAPPAVLPKSAQSATRGPDVIAAVIQFEDDLEAENPATMFRVTGRGITPSVVQPAEADVSATEGDFRRNFSEVGRILRDRVPTEPPPADVPAAMDPPIEPMPTASRVQDSALVSVGAETFILNRLPLGILVFRDQQVLFANRAFTDLVGYANVGDLRAAGLSAIFPDDDPAAAGPVTELVRRDSARMAVTARLQSVTWQGRPALMLSAAIAERKVPVEAAVRNFAAELATRRSEGFIALDRSGMIAAVSDRAAALLGKAAATGQPMSGLLDDPAASQLREFLERPARFAETERPMLGLRGPAGTTIVLVAEGMAGVVSGYFGLVASRPIAEPTIDAPRGDDPSMLARVSRGVRRPLNTIIGFADLIRSAAFGTIENHRYLEYARDIRTAGHEIAVLIDELDDYARLRAGTYPVRPADLDLSALLESCILRVRGQAGAARVLVRSAIPENLPHVRADRASLGQAVLNLMSSAIDQTPPNGSVILSAQRDEAGGVVVNIRDSGEATADPGERFVVFRDGVGKDGETLAPVRSSVGLALTRSLIAVNACSLSVTPAGAIGTIFSLTVPADLTGPAAA